MPPPPPSYNVATNYGYQGSPQQAATVRVDDGPAYSPVPTEPATGYAYPPQNQYPPPSQYPPPANHYAPPPQNQYPPANQYPPPGAGYTDQDAYPKPAGAYPPPQTGYPQAGYPQAGYPQAGFPQAGYPQSQQGFPPSQPGNAAYPPDSETVRISQPKPPEPWEDGNFAGNSFSDKNIRMAFIRKVYMILMVQLMFTAGVVLFFSLHEPTKMWVRRHSWIYWPSYGVFLVTYIILVCCPSVRRKWPVNFVCLIIFTCALTYMAGMISSTYSTQSVAVAMGITAGVSLAISIFACQTKWDFTKCGGILFAGCIALFLFGIVCMIWYMTMGYSRILQCVYGGIAALLFSMFLAYDTQMLIGGKKFELSPEDHVFGALQLYLDIVYLFLIILSLFGSSD